jgi:hypothetical protein
MMGSEWAIHREQGTFPAGEWAQVLTNTVQAPFNGGLGVDMEVPAGEWAVDPYNAGGFDLEGFDVNVGGVGGDGLFPNGPPVISGNELLPNGPPVILDECGGWYGGQEPQDPGLYPYRTAEGEVLLPPADNLRGADGTEALKMGESARSEDEGSVKLDEGGLDTAGSGGEELNGGGAQRLGACGTEVSIRSEQGIKRKNEEPGPEPALVVGREKRLRRGCREVDGWVGMAEGYLRKGTDDEAWGRCVDLWVQLENTALSTNSRLTELSLRPMELTKWVGSRRWDADPAIGDVADYARRWLAWWLAMQPSSRKVEGQELPSPLQEGTKKDVMSLKKAGLNGLVVLLVGLKWWAPLRGKDRRWGAVVDDVVSCLETFVC